ncbi:MAG: YihY/virulence factor BrkB family protein [Polyangiaceae bacterium]|nr:YihY/virulence factor BrkB family protein [Polyangiaceae bacterium]
MRAAWSLLREAIRDFREDEAQRHAAALAYYAVLSFGPVLFVVVAVAGWAIGNEAARSRVLEQIATYVGPEAAESAEVLMRGADLKGSTAVIAPVGIGILLFGASKVFAELERSLDTIWEVPVERSRGIRNALVRRATSLALLIGVALLLLVELGTSTTISALAGRTEGFLPGGSMVFALVHALASVSILTVAFAVLFKSVPAAPVSWRDVWLGAGTTALFLAIGQTMLGVFLGRHGWTSAYGAAASVIALLAWVYYAAQIFLFGAELTQVFACRFGSRKACRHDQPTLRGDEDEGSRETLPGESPETRRSRTGLRWGIETP